MSPPPTFGSYAKPTPFKVEASPYFWWWYALSLNAGYRDACGRGGRGYEAVFGDFGDICFEGDRHKAFCDWWRKRVNEHEELGGYLFAEPIADRGVKLVPDMSAALKALERDDTILVSIPITSQRKHIDRRLDRILKRHLTPVAARVVRSPSQSKARYRLNKPVVASALKKSFDLLDEKLKAEANGERVDNFELARRARVKVTEREKADEINTQENYRRTVSATVSRYIKSATLMIDNVARGSFP